jgi:hypothetical protein
MDAIWLIPIAIIVLLVIGMLAFGRAATRANLRRHGGSTEAAMGDADDPVPSTPFIPDDATPAGDSPELHDEIDPHDLPPDHPGRHAAEERQRRHEAEERQRRST